MPRLTVADSISTMAAPTAAVGKMEKLTGTASARDPRAKVHTPAAGTMVSRSLVSTPGLGEIRPLLSYEFSGMLSIPVFLPFRLRSPFVAFSSRSLHDEFSSFHRVSCCFVKVKFLILAAFVNFATLSLSLSLSFFSFRSSDLPYEGI